MSTFGATLKTIRERRRFSQSRLARIVDADHSHISRLESGSRVPSRDMVHALAHALNATPTERDELLHAAGFATVAYTPEIEAFAALPVNIQRNLLAIADMMTRKDAA